MDLMKTRRLVRRSLLTAAVSTASLLATFESRALGFEITASPASSGIQRVQYQPGQQGQPAQANPAVTAELKKMFEESGQPMPSMNPRDLPNAQGQQMNNVRPTQRPAGQQYGKPQSYMKPASAQKTSTAQAGMQQVSSTAPAKAQQPAKKNFLQKFMGGITGQNKKAADAAVVPPVPPGYVEPPPAPPSGGSSVAQAPKPQGAQGKPAAMQNRPSGVQTMQKNGKQNAAQNGMQSHLASQSRPMPAANSRPAVGSQSQVKNTAPQSNAPTKSVPVRTAQAAATNGQVRAASQPSQPIPAVPVAASSSPRNPRASAPPQPVASSQQFIQPGTAPAFMPSVKKNLNEVQAKIPQVMSPATAQSVPNPKPAMAEPKAPAKPNEDGFVDPFSESELAADANDSLDLDSLATPKLEETVQAAEAATTTVVEKSATASAAAANSLAENPFVEEAKELAKEAAGNPLTGVQLNTTDEEMFSADSAKTIVKKALPAATATTEAAEALRNSVPSVEEFEQSLPAIDLPTVEEAVDAAATELSTAPDINFPELDAQDAAEAQGNTPLVNTPQLQESAPAEASGTPLRSVDAERLQQIAEQDRRTHQQRLIQSRSGQAGFKGFCPVELRDRRELIDTNPQFTATFGLQTYTFSSAEAKAAFEADPSRYAPAAGGSDVVLLVNSGEEEQGMLDYALWYRDRLYLFRSRETMAMFNKDPQRFANQY
jgi:YHS domain-containing protein